MNMESAAGPSDRAGRARLKLWALLVAAAALAYVGTIPFFAPFMAAVLRLHAASVPLAMVLFAQGVQVTLLSALFAWIGVVFAPRVGLDAPLFRLLAGGRGKDAARHLSSIAWPAVLIGLGTGLALSLWRLLFASRLPEVLISSWTASFAAGAATASFAAGATTAFYGGVVEELIARWCVLSAVLRLLRRAGLADGFQVANLAAALLFGAGHLLALPLVGARLTAAAVVFIVAGNGLAGLVFGWLFRRRGLEAAMIAHAAVDLWLHAVSPLLLRR